MEIASANMDAPITHVRRARVAGGYEMQNGIGPSSAWPGVEK
jgi:hypothetical protein